MKKSILAITDLNKDVSNKDFNENFDFINQNYDSMFDNDKNDKYEDYVKVKYLKGKR